MRNDLTWRWARPRRLPICQKLAPIYAPILVACVPSQYEGRKREEAS